MSRGDEIIGCDCPKQPDSLGRHATELWLRIRRLGELTDDLVVRIYRNGSVQSLIVHAPVLLALALIVVDGGGRNPSVPLAIHFDSDPETVLNDSPILHLEPRATPLLVAQGESLEVGLPEPRGQPEGFDLPSLFTELPVSRRDPLKPTRRAAIHPSATKSTGSPGFRRNGIVSGRIDGELGRRLQAANARSGDVQVSIRWDDVNDIDVHVRVEPFGRGPVSMISFTSGVGVCGGMLDIDANAHPATLSGKPVENIVATTSVFHPPQELPATAHSDG